MAFALPNNELFGGLSQPACKGPLRQIPRSREQAVFRQAALIKSPIIANKIGPFRFAQGIPALALLRVHYWFYETLEYIAGNNYFIIPMGPTGIILTKHASE